MREADARVEAVVLDGIEAPPETGEARPVLDKAPRTEIDLRLRVVRDVVYAVDARAIASGGFAPEEQVDSLVQEGASLEPVTRPVAGQDSFRPYRQEQVALTLGCNRSQAFWRVVLPQARRGMVSAGILAWARSLGEFGPILVFAGSTRFRTEVLPTTVFLEMQSGNLSGMLAVSMIMIVAALLVLCITRYFGLSGLRRQEI